MYAFTFEAPTAVAQAVALAKAGGKLMAGGQSLLPSMKLRLSAPEQVVDLNRVSGLSGIQREGQAFVIGAMARHADVAANAELKAAIPALAELAANIGDRQVRARGTLGGSVANNDPAACYTSAVLGLGATVITDRREIAADDFFTGMYSTALEESELITAIRFPIPKRAAYMKFKQAASRFSLVGVFLAQTDSGVRVAITGAASCVFRHAGLEAALNQSFTPEAAASVKIDASGLNSDIHATALYRANLISVQTQRGVARALA
jgi:carbon-monoxide dehydrogenase medium subunit